MCVSPEHWTLFLSTGKRSVTPPEQFAGMGGTSGCGHACNPGRWCHPKSKGTDRRPSVRNTAASLGTCWESVGIDGYKPGALLPSESGEHRDALLQPKGAPRLPYFTQHARDMLLDACTCLGGLVLVHTVVSVLWALYRTLLRSGKNPRKYGEWAVVTGATDGIGKAISFELARKGCRRGAARTVAR